MTPPSARNGPSGIACFRASLPCRTKSNDGRHERDEEPDEHRDDDRDPEPGAEEGGELDVAHAEPPRIDEDDEEEHEPGSERAQDPLEARVVDRSEREDDDRAGRIDLVRNQAVLEVGARDHDEHPAEDRGRERLEREAVDEPTGSSEERRPAEDERETWRPRTRSEQRIVERRIRCEPVGERADERCPRAVRRRRQRRPRIRFPDRRTASCSHGCRRQALPHPGDAIPRSGGDDRRVLQHYCRM